MITFPEYEPARLGTAQINGQHVAVYCFERSVDVLVERDGMDRDGAEEWIMFNAIDTMTGGPIFVYPQDPT